MSQIKPDLSSLNSKSKPRESKPRPAFPPSLTASLLIAAVVILTAGAAVLLVAGPKARPSVSAAQAMSTESNRKLVERLISEQKFEEAAKEAARVRDAARRSGDEPLWTWTLVKEVQLRIALHGYETAVRFLKEEPWPSSPVNRDMLDLFFAHSLLTYCHSYSWEINRRERVESAGPLDLKSWTRDQIVAEAWTALGRVWKDRERLEAHNAKDYPDFWEAGDYPPGIRDTLRDAVVYVMARHLSDTSFWTPRESNETYRLDLNKLLTAPPDAASTAAVLDSAAAHPLEKTAALLAEHESWCRRASRPEGAMEARFERIAAMHEAFGQDDDRAEIRAALADYLDAHRRLPWWAVGQAMLAGFTKDEDAPDSRVRARKLALAGSEAYPDSPGGRRCLSIVKSIDAPNYSLDMMAADAPGRRSILFNHSNLGRLFLRAYRVDPDARIRTSKDRNIFPQGDEVKAFLDKGTPAAAWETALPPTLDYRDHWTYADLPADLAPGLYLVAASARRDFAHSENRITAMNAVVGDLILLDSAGDEDGLQVLVLSGGTGRPVAAATVELYAFDWKTGHRLLASQLTDSQGRAVFASRPRSGPCFLLARKGRDLAFDSRYLYLYSRSAAAEVTKSLIYTDRSVYRPGQKLYWKILAYRGREDLGRLSPAANAPASVWIEDGNGQRAAEAKVVTNAFGTASGEFAIPAAGRPLGSWRLRSSADGFARVRVEEYKRPTFEVTIKEPAVPLRLNRMAVMKAEARYYFGLPVVSGTAVWQVKREPVYPRWWWREAESGRSQTIAGGRARIKEDGAIEAAFTPRADERKAAAGISYRYMFSVEITDEGGETRTATRSFQLGFVNVEARIKAEAAFGTAGAPNAFSIVRSDLDGTPKPGNGAWRVARLIQPPATLLPADQPMPDATSDDPGRGAFRTPGDSLRPRWESLPSLEATLRLWKAGAEAASGKIEHDAQGAGRIAVPALEPGAYRLLYETKDDFGAVCRESMDFLVAAAPASSASSSPVKTPLHLPLVIFAERPNVPVGKTARILIHSGFADQPLLLETFKGGDIWQRRWIDSVKDGGILEIPVTEDLRGGFGARLTAVRDHQFMAAETNVFVPWDNKNLALSFSTFRDKLAPGGRETWRIIVKTPDGKPAVQGAAEVLAYMYDRSLDLFALHRPPSVMGLYPDRTATPDWDGMRIRAWQAYGEDSGWSRVPSFPSFRPDVLLELDGYGVGGPGGRVLGGVVGGVLGGVVGEVEAPSRTRMTKSVNDSILAQASMAPEKNKEDKSGREAGAQAEPATQLRSNFAETAFWQPHLLTGADGTAAIEFTVPDSVTSWRVFVHAVTRDLAGGTLEKEARTVKELMVRPYLPRFFREGDQAELRVMVNNAGAADMAGEVAIEIFDPETNENLAPAFGLPAAVPARPFAVKAGGGTAVTFPLAAPSRVGTVAFKVTARAGSFSDGELRPLPVLPGRMHLVQSRFATLKGDGAARVLSFADLAKNNDPTRINDKLVVTVDGQLFYGLLEALPYLVNYPYECTEQTLNRFLSTGILTSLYDKYPAVARMAQVLAAKRDTVYETFDGADANRKMGLEETPWLIEARGGTGGRDADSGMEKVLDPRVAAAEREASLVKLLKAQTSLGAFPWWPGGPPSPYMTLYIVNGFSKALEFGVNVPKEPVARAFKYLHRHYLDEIVRDMMARDTGWESVTFLNYVLSNFPDATWTGGVFTDAERRAMLDFSFKHWKEHAPYLKGYLALALKRAGAGRAADAALVWDSVMDSAKTTGDEGTSWAPEDRGWLWYNDTIETHAFALRTLMELRPADARSEGLVQWLFLNKKLNHWKSTRATAEVIYAVARYLKQTGGLGARETVAVEACGTRTEFAFEPDAYTGKKNQVVISGEKIGGMGTGSGAAGGAGTAAPSTTPCATVRVSKTGKGMAFAGATWHFSTERMPDKGEGDLFAVERSYFKREKRGDEVVLKPLAGGAALAVGDEVEVHLAIRARHPAEYVHLRDPRPAGCEPMTLRSGYRWDLGLARYEEIRDSGTNFFMERLPQGEYTLKHRLRCSMAGTFKAAPATLQSMYAPEFAAYSSGALIKVGSDQDK